MSGLLDPDEIAPGAIVRSAWTPSTGVLPNFAAGIQSQQAFGNSNARLTYETGTYRDIVSALAKRGHKLRGFSLFGAPDGIGVPVGTAEQRAAQEAVNWRAVAEERRRDPKFLSAMPTKEAFDKAIADKQNADLAAAGEVSDRATLAGDIAGFAGAMVGSLTDPLTWMTLPVGGELLGPLSGGIARRIGIAALREGAANAAVSAATLPVLSDDAARLGVEFGPREMALQVGIGAAAGAALGGAQVAAAPAADAAARAMTMSPRALADAVRGLRRPLTLAEKDAVRVLTREAEDLEATPFVATPEGDAEHAARLRATIEAFGRGEPAPAFEPAPVPLAEPRFDTAQAPEAPRFDTAPWLDAALAYAKDRKAGPLRADAVAAKLGLSVPEAHAVLGALASSGKARGVVVAGARGLRRPIQRRGPVDLITQIADMGGVRNDGPHDLVNTVGQRFVGGAGPLFRPKSGMDLDHLSEVLHEAGWFPGEDRPTTAQVIDLLDRALRTKVYHPEDTAAVLDRVEAAADAQWLAKARQEIAAAAEDLRIGAPEGDDMHAVLSAIAEGDDAATALERHINDLFEQARNEAASLDEADYAAQFFGGDDVGPGFGDQVGAGAPDGGGRAAVAGDAGEGGDSGAGVRNDAGQADGLDEFEAWDAAAAERGLAEFDDPRGPAVAEQADSIEHDLRADLTEWEQVDALKPDRDAIAEAQSALFAEGEALPGAFREEWYRASNAAFVGKSAELGRLQLEIRKHRITQLEAMQKIVEIERAHLARETAAMADIRARAEALDVAASAKADPGRGIPADDAATRSTGLKTAEEIAAAREAFAAAGGTVGPYGPVHPELSRDYAAAVERLLADQDGDVPGALVHAAIGPIDLVYGDLSKGLAHIADKHREVLAALPDIVAGLPIVDRQPSRIRLEDETHFAVVSLDHYGAPKKWLLTAFKKKGAPGAPQGGPDAPLPPGRTTYSQPGPSGDLADQAGGGKMADRPSMTMRQQGEVEARLQQEGQRRLDQQALDQIEGGFWDAAAGQQLFDLGDGAGPRTVKQVLDAHDAEAAAIKAVRDCL